MLNFALDICLAGGTRVKGTAAARLSASWITNRYCTGLPLGVSDAETLGKELQKYLLQNMEI